MLEIADSAVKGLVPSTRGGPESCGAESLTVSTAPL
jgi:hypothetical protein